MRTSYLALAAIGVLACESGGAPLLISEAAEIEIGAQTHEQILLEMPIYQDEVVQNYVRGIGNRLVPVSGRPNLQHQFFVVETPEVNAFAVPGGFVYVTTGLLANMSSESELAGVMGHEVGHISAYHGAKALEVQYGISIITQFLGEDAAAVQEVLGFSKGFYDTFTKHSQDQELEADQLGVTFATEANYNPWGMVAFFEFIEPLVGQQDGISEFLSSHPPPSQRIADSSVQIQGLGISKGDSRYITGSDDPEFLDVRQRVAQFAQ